MSIKVKLSLLPLVMSAAAVNASTPPPNTLAQGSLVPQQATQQSYNVIGVSPGVYQQAPASIQPYLVPSMQQQIQQEVVAYQTEQLTPQQLIQLKQTQEGQERITSLPYSSTPIPVNRSLSVNLSPDAPLPTIRMAKDMLTTIAFTDEDGTPWEVEKVSVNGSLFTNHTQQPNAPQQYNEGANNSQQEMVTRETVTQDGLIIREQVPATPAQTQPQPDPRLAAPQRANNIVSLEPNNLFSYSNLVIHLKGKANPLVFILTTGQREVDMLVSARVGGKNPDKEYQPGASRVSVETVIDESALQFLDGRTPAAATSLVSSDGQVQAWELNGKLFIKTRLNVLYPAYTARAGLDGMFVYRFDDVNKVKMVTLLQRQGQPVNVQFSQTPYYLR